MPPKIKNSEPAHTQTLNSSQQDRQVRRSIQAPTAPINLANTITSQGLSGRIGLSRNLFKALTRAGFSEQHTSPFTKILQATVASELPTQTELSSYSDSNQRQSAKFFIPEAQNLQQQAQDHPCINLLKAFCGKAFVRPVTPATSHEEINKIKGTAAYLVKMLASHDHPLESFNILLDRRFSTTELKALLDVLPNTPDLLRARVSIARNVIMRGQARDEDSLQDCLNLPADLKDNIQIRSLVAAMHGRDLSGLPDQAINQIINVHNQNTPYDSLDEESQLNPFIGLAELCADVPEYETLHQGLQNNRNFALLAAAVNLNIVGDMPVALYSDREFLLTAFPDRIDHHHGERYIPEDRLVAMPYRLVDDYEVALGLHSSGWSADTDEDEDEPELLTNMPLEITSQRLKDDAGFMLKVQKLNGNGHLTAMQFLNHCSQRLKNDHSFMKTYISNNLDLLDGGIEGGRVLGAICLAAPPIVRNDPEFNLSLLKQDFRFMPYIGNVLTNNTEFMQQAIQIEPAAIHWAGPAVQRELQTQTNRLKRQRID